MARSSLWAAEFLLSSGFQVNSEELTPSIQEFLKWDPE
jgi:hypothetical protein